LDGSSSGGSFSENKVSSHVGVVESSSVGISKLNHASESEISSSLCGGLEVEGVEVWLPLSGSVHHSLLASVAWNFAPWSRVPSRFVVWKVPVSNFGLVGSSDGVEEDSSEHHLEALHSHIDVDVAIWHVRSGWVGFGSCKDFVAVRSNGARGPSHNLGFVSAS